jgi:hypothetical protein
MAETPSVDAVETGDNYYHVRYADPDGFDAIRTPDWAAKVAGSVLDGSEVRTGHEADGGDDEWSVQSVLVPVEGVSDEEEARSVADDIVAKINE